MPTVDEYKCRNCGNSLNLSAAVNGVLHCEYCHSSFTVPKKETSPAALDFIRTGEHELDTCSFDRAYAAYQKAGESDPSEPEAYFGMALSEFKVQYLHDGAHNCLQPICHEVSDKVFTRNKNYRRAIELATPEQRSEYEHKGQDINTVRDEFLSLQEDGIDYDSFICVKVTDDNTKGKTADYYIANELYTNLKEKGYKPFYSEPILKGKTGSAYEAHILYALNKAECMLIVCSDEEYLKTPWVKSEYTRFGELLRAEEKERDSVTFVYNARPIERFPDGGKRIQGIDYTRNDAYSKIYDFVESHTPAAKQRKAEAENRRKAEEEQQKYKLEEQERALAEQRKLLEELKRQAQGQNNAVKFCVACGAENPQNVKFCGECGGKEFAATAKEYAEIVRQRAKEEVAAALTEKQSTEEKAQEAAKEAEESGIPTATSLFDFEIENGELKKYKGKGGNVVIPDSVTSIGYGAFYDCNSLTNIIIPQSVTSIGYGAFSGCNNLTHIIIPSSITDIGNYMFSNCSSLTSITIPQSVINIGQGAFKGCSGLTSVTISQSRTKIGDGAFEGCSALTSVTMPKVLEALIKGVFGKERKHIKFTFTE